MAARLTLPRTAAWVWHGEPRSIFGLEAVFVRCASGTSGTAGSGFSYADNFHAWLQARGPAVVPGRGSPPHSADGEASADALAAIAPGQQVYVVEVGPETPPAQVGAFAARMRLREPIAAIGFSSWPTRAEAEQAAVPWDACVEAFDFGLPQVCTPAQRKLLVREDSPVVADMAGKPIHVVVFPDADPGWLESARVGVDEHAGASAFSVEQSSRGLAPPARRLGEGPARAGRPRRRPCRPRPSRRRWSAPPARWRTRPSPWSTSTSPASSPCSPTASWPWSRPASTAAASSPTTSWSPRSRTSRDAR